MRGPSGLLRVAVVYPDLLGTYGDGGNGLILARRAEWRGLEVELLQAASDAALPGADIYCLGGGEDGPQVHAARTLLDDGGLSRRVADGAVVLAVCAGYQVAGRSFPGAEGEPHEGLGLLPLTTAKVALPRAVGEVVAEPDESMGLPVLTGFENHGGRSTLEEERGRWPVSRPASATATAPRGRWTAGWSGPICTVRCWPATPRWPTCSCRGPSTPPPWRRSTMRRRRACGPNGSRRDAPDASGGAGRPESTSRCPANRWASPSPSRS